LPSNYDLLIKNAQIVDGTGQARFKGDIAIHNDRIGAIGQNPDTAAIVIDGDGLVATPGFIDPHSHADLTILKHPRAENLVMQGITTFIGGNCGGSLAPMPEIDENRKAFLSQGDLAEFDEWAWISFDEYLDKVESTGTALNFVPMVGHNTLRYAVMGGDFKRAASPTELEQMLDLLEESMQDGAFALSAQLDPGPGLFASFEEIVACCKLAQKFGGLYVPHTRHINPPVPNAPPPTREDIWVDLLSGSVYRGYMESLAISQAADIPLHIAHLGNAYPLLQPHSDDLENSTGQATAEIFVEARNRGIDVSYDVIATPFGVSGEIPMIFSLISLLDKLQLPGEDAPKERDFRGTPGRSFSKSEKDRLVEKLNMPELRQLMFAEDRQQRLIIGGIVTSIHRYWINEFRILSCSNQDYQDSVLGDIAKAMEMHPFELVLDILKEDPDTTWIRHTSAIGTDPSIAAMLDFEHAMPSTDLAAWPLVPGPNDRPTLPATACQLYPYYLSNYAREMGKFSLEEAVRKATSVPAKRFGIPDRGVLKEGAFADIVLLKYKNLKMTDDLRATRNPPQGIEKVLINGKVVWNGVEHTGVLPGKVLRRT